MCAVSQIVLENGVNKPAEDICQMINETNRVQLNYLCVMGYIDDKELKAEFSKICPRNFSSWNNAPSAYDVNKTLNIYCEVSSIRIYVCATPMTIPMTHCFSRVFSIYTGTHCPILADKCFGYGKLMIT